MKHSLTAFLFTGLITLSIFGKENVGNPNQKVNNPPEVAAGCNPGTSQMDLSVNNVRTKY